MTFKKIIYSGICLCGHPAEDHHGSMVVNIEAAKIMGPRFPEECLRYGFNENGGDDENGNYHCGRYVDKDDPDPSKWKGTYRDDGPIKWESVK